MESPQKTTSQGRVRDLLVLTHLFQRPLSVPAQDHMQRLLLLGSQLSYSSTNLVHELTAAENLFLDDHPMERIWLIGDHGQFGQSAFGSESLVIPFATAVEIKSGVEDRSSKVVKSLLFGRKAPVSAKHASEGFLQDIVHQCPVSKDRLDDGAESC